MNPFEILMRGTAQFTGMIPGSSMSMPLNVRPDYTPGALVPSRGGGLVPSRGGALTPPQPSARAPMGQGGAIVPYNKGVLSNVAPKVFRGGAGLSGIAGKVLGPLGLAFDAYGTGKDLVDSLNRGEGFAAIPGLIQKMSGGNNRGNSSNVDGREPTTYGPPGFIGPVPQAGAEGQYGPPTPTRKTQRGVFTIDGYNPNLTIDEYREQVIPTRKNLEDRAYQQEASRLAQQTDPFANVGFTNTGGGRPMLQYGADEGMAISRALYGDQLTPNTPNPLMAGLVYDETNPMMQGRNYNMENPVGVQQSSAQSLADYYRNGMIEQQTQGMGSEPGLESVLSPEDREMFLQQLSSFRPGGPG